MPIPNFSIDGILPPFIGRLGPGDTMEDMSPYAVSALEVVTTLGGTEQRKSVLRGWLQHRAALRGAGYGRGFQWLDGSFVEAKEPKDIDVVAFLYRPGGIIAANELAKSMEANIELFDRDQVKVAFHVDFFPIDLDGPVETMNLPLFDVSLGCTVQAGILPFSASHFFS